MSLMLGQVGPTPGTDSPAGTAAGPASGNRTRHRPARTRRRRGGAHTRVRVVITGGGTAGHVLPALSVGRALVDLGYDPGAVHFVGSRRGIEATLVPAAGFDQTLLPGRGIARRLTLDNLGAAAGIALAFGGAARLLARLRPAVVVTVGGYAGLPAALVALAARIPVVVVNVDAVPGASNRLVGRFATLSAVALPGTDLPRAVVTGAPVRPEVLAVDRTPAGRAAARTALGLAQDSFVVAVTGGSLGAHRINVAAAALPATLAAPLPSSLSALPPAAPSLAPRGDVLVYHVSGQRDHAEMVAATRALSPGSYRLVAYESRLPTLLAACDVLVARAGASTIAEVTALGVPSVLVPLPGAPADHQRRNAEVLVAAGAAVLVEDGECTAERLAEIVGGLRDDPARLSAMGVAAASLGRPGAAAEVARLVDALARRGEP